MFGLIKWIFVISIIVGIWYLLNFYWSLGVEDKQYIKRDLIEAIEAEDSSVFIDPLKEKIREDIEQKKRYFYDEIKQDLKDRIK